MKEMMMMNSKSPRKPQIGKMGVHQRGLVRRQQINAKHLELVCLSDIHQHLSICSDSSICK